MTTLCSRFRQDTFGSGRNFANAIAGGFGIEKWWKEQEYLTAAREANHIFKGTNDGNQMMVTNDGFGNIWPVTTPSMY